MAVAQYRKYCIEYGQPPSNPRHLRAFAAGNNVKIKWIECRQIIQNPPKNLRTMTYNKSFHALDLAVSTENLFKQTSRTTDAPNMEFLSKDMDEWTVREVHEWILSVEESKLYSVAKQLQKKQVNGLMLMGVNHKYLKKLGINKQEAQLLLKSRDQILNPPSITRKPSGLHIPFTSLEDTRALSIDINASAVHLAEISETVEIASSTALDRPGEIVESRMNDTRNPLDDALISELVQAGLSEHFTKSYSFYDQEAVLSPKYYQAQPPGQEEKDMRALGLDKRPQFKLQLTPANLPEVRSKKSVLNKPNLEVEVNTGSKLSPFAMPFDPDPDSPPQQQHLSSLNLLTMKRYFSAPLPVIDEDHMNGNEHESKSDEGGRSMRRMSIPTNYKRKGHKRDVYISRKLTEMISNRIQEEIPKDILFEYIHLSMRLQHRDQYNHGNVRIFDFDFRDRDGQKLYCMVEKTQNRTKGQLEWTMKEALYTQQEIDDMDEFYEIPKSTRDTFDDLKVQQNQISDKLTEKTISATKWCKVPTKSKLNGKYRRILALSKEEFVVRLRENINMKDINLIPIIVFHHNHNFHIEYVQIVKIDEGVDIGISYKKDQKHGVSVSGIYVNKQQLCNLHYLISPQHIASCHCFDGFTTNIDQLTIGNPDDQQNRINDLKNQVKLHRLKNKKLKQEIEHLKKEMSTQQEQNQMNLKANTITYSQSTPQFGMSPVSNTSSSSSESFAHGSLYPDIPGANAN